jgi:membrane-bound lytic murein transglycosylase D
VGSQLFIPDITPDQTRQARKRAAAAHQKILQYYVRKGDNLWNISNRFNISLQTLLAANDLSQGDVLHIGKQLQIPVPDEKSAPPAEPATTDRKHVEFYTIKPGDTLWAIARRFEVSVADLRSWNSLDADHLLQPGQSVKIIFK